MSTFSALYYHLVWSTKDRIPHISEKIEEQLYKYIFGIMKNKDVHLIQIGGIEDHIYMLIRVSPDNNLATLVKDIKVSTTKFIKTNYNVATEFSWQRGYGIFSVSKSMTDQVKEYILKQKEHHANKSFVDEYIGFLQKHSVEYDEKYIFS
ncbi:MAG: IS200/IS605 family transposase [Parachlamydiaceae bacterium]|nr:IS200/IS605 family transposase [Parachlamydiaceae bacterium]